MIKDIEVNNITAFESLRAEFSPGLNIFIGENGTGKTHLMKILYSACSIAKKSENKTIEQKLVENFLPDSVGRLVRRARGRKSGKFWLSSSTESDQEDRKLGVTITTLNRVSTNSSNWKEEAPEQVVYIPVKDMLANAPGFLSLYSNHTIHFEGIYADIISKALYPASRGRRNKIQRELLNLIEAGIGGTIATEGEEFYLKSTDGSGNLEFTLLAEGYRKLGLLFCLVQNEMLTKGSILFWDEPETNLNPNMMELIVKILYKRVDLGVQIFISTHNSMLTSQIKLCEANASTKYHLFSKDQDGRIKYANFNNLQAMEENPINKAYESLLLKQIKQELSL